MTSKQKVKKARQAFLALNDTKASQTVMESTKNKIFSSNVKYVAYR